MFVPEVRKYLASNRLTFKGLLILDNATGHPEPHEFNTEDVELAYFTPKHKVSNSASRWGVIRSFEAHFTQYSMERMVNIMKENHDRENIMQVWKVYTIEDAIVIIEKAVKAIKPEIINSCQRKLCPDVVHDFTEFTTEPVEEIRKEIVDVAKGGRGCVKGFKIWISEKFKS